MTHAEARTLWERLVRPILQVEPVDDPQAWFMGGQPGAGKTRAITVINELRSASILEIDGDTFRPLHPLYQRALASDPYSMPSITAPTVAAWMQYSIDYALAQRASYLVHGTWRSPSVIGDGVRLAASHGYPQHAIVVATPPEISRLAVLQRFYQALEHGRDARWTPLDIHDEAVAALPESVAAVASSTVTTLQIIARDGRQLTGPLPVSAHRRDQALDAFHAEFTRDLTPAEQALQSQLASHLYELHHTHTRTDPEAQEAWERLAAPASRPRPQAGLSGQERLRQAEHHQASRPRSGPGWGPDR